MLLQFDVRCLETAGGRPKTEESVITKLEIKGDGNAKVGAHTGDIHDHS